MMRRSPSPAEEESDAARFIESTLVNPETGLPFVLTDAERLFLRHAFDLTPDGRLGYPELVFAAPKKSGKTAFAAMLLIYVTRCLGGRFAEAYTCANDYDQSVGRVFQAASRIVEASPLLRPDAAVTAGRIVFRGTGATITALANDYAGAAGANPTFTVFDEPWAYTSERSRRLFDEMVPPPTRKIAARLCVSYAGFSGESELLEGLYKRGMAGEQPAPDLYAAGGLLMFWTHRFTAPWQTPEWREQMREQLRPNQYLRLVENRWVSGEDSFVPIEWWDACVLAGVKPLLSDQALRVWVGVDASTKRDSTAIAVCAYDRVEKKVRLVWHRIFQPSPDDPLDFEATVETTLLHVARRFRLREVRYDPYQMAATAQRLSARGIPMEEFPQTVGNLTAASTNLYELVKGANLVAYPDADVRLAIQRAVAVETARGWKISKAVQSHKIDVVVALGMAALGAVQEASRPAPMILSRDALQRIASTPPRDRFAAMNAPRNRFARVR
jgi:phage terminase large subunit-like protein